MSDSIRTLWSRCLSALNPFKLENHGEYADQRASNRIRGNALTCTLGDVLDISETGARIHCRRFFRPHEGKNVSLQIEPKDPKHAVTLSGTICWTTLDNGQWFAGVAFGAMSDADAITLGALLHEHTSEPVQYSDAA